MTHKVDYINTSKNKETITNEEVMNITTDDVDIISKIHRKTKIRLVKRGFILGLVTAIALQSLSTIVVMLILMT